LKQEIRRSFETEDDQKTSKDWPVSDILKKLILKKE
jgi:hypothetical protein